MDGFKILRALLLGASLACSSHVFAQDNGKPVSKNMRLSVAGLNRLVAAKLGCGLRRAPGTASSR